MATHVDDVDLTSLRSVTVPPHASGAVVLVRWAKVPIGLIRIHASGAISAERIRSAVNAQLQLPPTAPQRPRRASPVSIVVCTHERPQDLERCLTHLQSAAAAGHEVIVVDNAPKGDATAAVATRFPVRYVCERRLGLNNARNLGLREASHPLVAYIDDDAVADAHWIDGLSEPFTDPHVGCTTGLVLPLELRTPAQHLFEVYAQNRRIFRERTFTSSDTPPSTAGVVGIGANMALRRDLACSLGGFDPRLDAGTPTCSGGDNDIFARILETGASITYTPRALVWHRHRDTREELNRCLFGYGVGVYAFLTKRLVEHRDLGALATGIRWLIGPFFRAASNRLAGDEAVPVRLLLIEAAGALLGPSRFLHRGAHE